MDDKTNQAPEQSGMPDNEEYSSYTLPTEDAAAQERAWCSLFYFFPEEQ